MQVEERISRQERIGGGGDSCRTLHEYEELCLQFSEIVVKKHSGIFQNKILTLMSRNQFNVLSISCCLQRTLIQKG